MTNDIKLSQEFKQKLRFMKDITIEYSCEINTILDNHSTNRSFPMNFFRTIRVYNISYHDLRECEKWLSLTYRSIEKFENKYKIDIGPFQGLFPIEVGTNEVKLRAENYKPSWRDWFIVDEDFINDKNFKRTSK